MIVLMWLVLIFISIFVAAATYFRFCYWGRLLSKIPGRTSFPLIGNCWDILFLTPESLFKILREIRTEFDGISKILLFHEAAINIYHPDDVEVILSTPNHNEKHIPYNFLRPWLQEGLLTSNGQKWKQRRKLLTPAFHFNILRRFCATFNEHTSHFLGYVQAETDNEFTNLIPLITNTTLNIMCETSMGTSVKNDTQIVVNKYFNALHQFGKVVVERYSKLWYHLDCIYNYSLLEKRERKIMSDLHRFTTNIIQERKSVSPFGTGVDEDFEHYTGKKRLAMLDWLLENESQNKIDINGIREEVDTFLFEGHDTTAMALCFMIMRIANEPLIQEKIHEELLKIFGTSDRSPTTDDLSELKYLECCIKESLRIYPSVPFIARYITEEVELGGYKVPAKTIIHIHVFDIHRDPTIYPDPERFLPERFLLENSVKRHPYAYIPFSAGPRNCIGQKFAMLEMKTVMSGLLRRFKLEPVTKPEDVVFMMDMVLRSKEPLLVRFRPRAST